MTAAPRFTPLADSDWPAEHRALLRGKLPAADRYLTDDVAVAELPNILGLFGRHPQLAAQWLGWNAGLLEVSTLAPRLRELMILRIAWRTQCLYEWAQHELIGRDAGLTENEIAAVAGHPWPWEDVERDLIDATDQVIECFRVGDETWQRLAGRFDHRELLEILFLIGSYCALAQVLNSAHLPPDPSPDGHVPTLPALEDRP